MRGGRSVTPWFPVAVDPLHEGIYEVEYRQSRFIFRREWRDEFEPLLRRGTSVAAHC